MNFRNLAWKTSKLFVFFLDKNIWASVLDSNSTLRYECDETFSDEWEFAARAEGE